MLFNGRFWRRYDLLVCVWAPKQSVAVTIMQKTTMILAWGFEQLNGRSWLFKLSLVHLNFDSILMKCKAISCSHHYAESHDDSLMLRLSVILSDSKVCQLKGNLGVKLEDPCYVVVDVASCPRSQSLFFSWVIVLRSLCSISEHNISSNLVLLLWKSLESPPVLDSS